MAYKAIQRSVNSILKRADGPNDIKKAIADLHRGLSDRQLEIAVDHAEGASDHKGHLESAINDLESAYNINPSPSLANQLRLRYHQLGDLKKQHHMPGYDDDYEKSQAYEEIYERSILEIHKK